MKSVFVDTSFLIAFHHAGDPFHADARKLMDERMVEQHPFQLIVTDYIFDEFVTVMQKASSKDIAAKTGDSLLKNSQVKFHWITDEGFEQAWSVFKRFQDKNWSFTDCTSYAWIQENRPDFCLATDPDFDEFGLVTNLMRI